jgi:hypothetical protein
LGRDVDPVPEVLLLYVAADQLRNQPLLADQVRSSFVLLRVHAFVGSDQSLQLDVSQDALPFVEENAAVLGDQIVGVDNFLSRDGFL